MTEPDVPEEAQDATPIIRSVAQQGAAALAEVWVRVAMLEAQLAAQRAEKN